MNPLVRRATSPASRTSRQTTCTLGDCRLCLQLLIYCFDVACSQSVMDSEAFWRSYGRDATAENRWYAIYPYRRPNRVRGASFRPDWSPPQESIDIPPPQPLMFPSTGSQMPLQHLKEELQDLLMGNADEQKKKSCPICLQDIERIAFTSNCKHAFCSACIWEWSKIKPECPVCRSRFTRLFFNVRAMDKYDEIVMPRRCYRCGDWRAPLIRANTGSTSGSTLTANPAPSPRLQLRASIEAFQRRMAELQQRARDARIQQQQQNGQPTTRSPEDPIPVVTLN